MMDAHVENVAFSTKIPHDMLAKYDEKFVSQNSIVDPLESHGFHVDITGGYNPLILMQGCSGP